MPTCRTGHSTQLNSTRSLTQLILVRSQIDGHHARGTLHSHRVTTTRWTARTTSRIHSEIAVNHRADLLTTAPFLGNYHTRWNISSTSLNFTRLYNNNLTAKINTYSLAFTFPLYRDVSINSSDVGHFKLAHPLTLQIFIRLFKYAWRQTGYGDLKPDPRWNISQAWRAQLTWLEAHWSAYGSYICIGSVT